jgi:hypothetical protein
VWVVNGEDIPLDTGPVRRATAFMREMRQGPWRRPAMPGPERRPLGPPTAESNTSNTSCLPRTDGGTSRASVPCLIAAHRRIQRTTFHYLVFPISLSLPAAAINATLATLALSPPLVTHCSGWKQR